MAIGVKFTNSSADNNWGNLVNWVDSNGASATALPNGTTNVKVVAEVDSDSTGSNCLCASATFLTGGNIFAQINYPCIFKETSTLSGPCYGTADFYDSSRISNGDGGYCFGTATFHSTQSIINVMLLSGAFASSPNISLPSSGGSVGVPLARLLRLPFPVNL